MQVKIFLQKGAALGGLDIAFSVETDINQWLDENPDIHIHDVRQSMSGGSFDAATLVVSVWYDDSNEME
jgi:hypothetical protein